VTKIFSPIASGNGAHVVHKMLSDNIPDYYLYAHNPYWTLIPVALPFLFKEICYPGIIHSTPDHGFLFAKKFHTLVVTFHNYVLDSYMANYSSLLQHVHYRTDLRYFTQKALKRAASVTAVSHFTADLVKTDLKYPGDIKVIYNGIDTDKFIPAHPIPTKGDQLKVLFSGNLIRRKGADLLPLIADRLPKNVQILYTCGLRTKHSLPNHPQLENIGSISYIDMPKIYQNADILLFPTIREGFGLAAAEAMACGLPVVASNCSSLPELIVNGKGGYLCETGNVESFVEAIVDLANSPTKRQEMGQFNRERAERLFSLDRMVLEYRQLFDQLAS
jgi:glycosyltransferase involved in cell wall biosynthesis